MIVHHQKQKNHQLHYTTIIDKICRQQFASKNTTLERAPNAVNTVIANTVESRMYDAFALFRKDQSINTVC